MRVCTLFGVDYGNVRKWAAVKTVTNTKVSIDGLMDMQEEKWIKRRQNGESM
jgi:hypothetical protein